MTSPRIRVTDRSLQKAMNNPTGFRYEIKDALLPGLIWRVSPTGQLVPYARMRQPGAPTATWQKLGPAYPITTLAQARERGAPVLRALSEGDRPTARVAARPPVDDEALFENVAKDFIKKYLPKLRSGQAVEASIRRWVIPALGNKAIGDIQRRDIIATIEAVDTSGQPVLGQLRVTSGGKHAARKTLAATRRLFGWALTRGVPGLTTNPCTGIAPKDLFSGDTTEARERALADNELRLLWQVCEDAKAAARARAIEQAAVAGRAVAATVTDPFAVLYQVLISTGQRKNEIARAKRSEIDFNKAVLHVPAARMKAGKAHDVPLTAGVLRLLSELPNFGPNSYLFSTDGRKPITGFSRAQHRIRAAVDKLAAPAVVPHWQVHDLRRSARTGLSDVGVDSFIGELIIAHTPQSSVQRAYDKHGYLDQKRAGLEAWEARLLAIVGATPPDDDKVVTLPKRRRA
jgi:integrase